MIDVARYLMRVAHLDRKMQLLKTRKVGQIALHRIKFLVKFLERKRTNRWKVCAKKNKAKSIKTKVVCNSE